MKSVFHSVAVLPLIVGIVLAGFHDSMDLSNSASTGSKSTVSSLGFEGWVSFNSNCISEGTSQDECFDRPPLPSGTPGGIKWGDNHGSPTGWDEDFGFDDPLGDATPSADGSSACIPVTNTGGELRGPAIPQTTIEVVVLDASTNQPVAGATITELTSGEIVVADSQGYASFMTSFGLEGVVQFKVEGASYSDGYFERILAPTEAVTRFDLGLTADNEYVSPVIGPAGGSKTFLLDTGQKYYDSSTGIYTPYYQSLAINVPQGALSSNYRLGLTPIPDSSDNNINLSVLPPHSVVVAEFRLNWLDIYGQSVASPALAQPIEISMNSGNIFYNDKLLTGSWAVNTYTFDNSLVAWNLNTGAASLQSGALLKGDLTDGGLIAFVARETISPAPEFEGTCKTYWGSKKWQGPPLNEETITCPNQSGFPGGTQTTQGIDDTVTESGSVSGSASAEVGGPLKALGFRVEVKGNATSEWSKTNRRNAKWEPGAWIGKQGTVYIREIGYNICFIHECLHDGVMVEHVTDCEGPFKTGVAVDASGLTDCP